MCITVFTDNSEAIVEAGSLNADEGSTGTDVTEPDIMQPTLEQQLEMALRASRCTPTTVISQSDSSQHDRKMLAAIKAEMAVFASSGHRGRFLQHAYDYLMTVPATSVEAERAFSAAGLICTKIRSRLGDVTVDTLSFMKAFYRDTVLTVA